MSSAKQCFPLIFDNFIGVQRPRWHHVAPPLPPISDKRVSGRGGGVPAGVALCPISDQASVSVARDRGARERPSVASPALRVPPDGHTRAADVARQRQRSPATRRRAAATQPSAVPTARSESGSTRHHQTKHDAPQPASLTNYHPSKNEVSNCLPLAGSRPLGRTTTTSSTTTTGAI
jgi:hypothetical protein